MAGNDDACVSGRVMNRSGTLAGQDRAGQGRTGQGREGKGSELAYREREDAI